MGHRAVLIDAHAHALHRARQPAYQFGWVNGRHVGGVNAAVGFGDPDLLRQLLRTEPAVIAFVEPLLVELVQILAQAGFLLRIAGSAVQRAPFAVIAVDAFTFQDNRYFIRNGV
ncbi:hypothetical protein D3C87_1474520 [compost metagenome]